MERPCSSPRLTLLLALGLAFGFAFGFAAGLTFGFAAGLTFALAARLAFALAAGLPLALTAALPLALAFGLALGLTVGLTLGLALRLALGDRVGWADAHRDAERRDGRGELEGVTPADAGRLWGLLVPLRHRFLRELWSTYTFRARHHSIIAGVSETARVGVVVLSGAGRAWRRAASRAPRGAG